MIAGAQTIYWSSVPSAYGTCNVLATEKGVCWTGTPGTLVDEGIVWVRRRFQVEHIVKGQKVAPLQQAVDELRRYLEGEVLQFSCSLDLHGTVFQVAVWQELLRIPYGQTRSYLEIARAIGQPTAVRAVGAANGANPVAIIVPCHRVIGSNGKLTGYGGGLPTKDWLLSLERAALHAPSDQPQGASLVGGQRQQARGAEARSSGGRVARRPQREPKRRSPRHKVGGRPIVP